MTITERLEAVKAEVEAAGREAAERVEAAVAVHLPAIMNDDLMQSVEAAAGLPGWARTFLAGLVTQGCAELAKHVATDAGQPAPAAPGAPESAPAPVDDAPPAPDASDDATAPSGPVADGPAV